MDRAQNETHLDMPGTANDHKAEIVAADLAKIRIAPNTRHSLEPRPYLTLRSRTGATWQRVDGTIDAVSNARQLDMSLDMTGSIRVTTDDVDWTRQRSVN